MSGVRRIQNRNHGQCNPGADAEGGEPRALDLVGLFLDRSQGEDAEDDGRDGADDGKSPISTSSMLTTASGL